MTHRKYNFLKSELEDFLASFIGKLDLTDPADKAIHDHVCAAIELADDTASRLKDQYDAND